MTKLNRKGAVGALLDVYEQTLEDFRAVIGEIPDEALTIVVDPHTTDENCRSVQRILAHVVHAGYGYATSIHNQRGAHVSRPEKTCHTTLRAYQEELTDMFAYTVRVFEGLPDHALRQVEEAQKIRTGWKQTYDIEQLTEHAIVHLLRHGRQLERIKRDQLAGVVPRTT
ncbi:DinB family protein [Catalinimonas alkaloidigena]|uniref:DinB family protein n=1 Tax=Catalinimonas alkaloidigena TaxID=1075417 RepID=A0A1G9R8S8_9BACT|nr:DinB family protein [Catalinimonas alkaloidigena]SDM19648.1 DinB family protein [Catalinimonas alkaloidigena]